MCALIGYRRGPAGHHRWATSRTRARSSPSSSRTSFSSSTCACCARVDRGWKSRSSSSLPRRAVKRCPPAEWREDDAYWLCGPEGLGLETGRWHWGASRDESVVAWLKPDHTWNMALGCSIPGLSLAEGSTQDHIVHVTSQRRTPEKICRKAVHVNRKNGRLHSKTQGIKRNLHRRSGTVSPVRRHAPESTGLSAGTEPRRVQPVRQQQKGGHLIPFAEPAGDSVCAGMRRSAGRDIVQ